jgi:hypothetical protein
MPGIRYEGRAPDSDSSLITRKWSLDNAAALAVTTSFVNAEIARVVAASNLQTTTYVDAQDGLLAKLSDVQAADALHLASTARGTTVASLDSSGMLTSTQVPSNLITERTARSVAATAPSFSGSYTCTTTSTREKLLATITVPDPGFPYHPLPFGFVSGQASSTAGLYPWSGNGILGQLTVCPPAESGDTIYGVGACSDSPTTGLYPFFPYGASGTTPTNRPAVSGTLRLDLYGCCLEGNGYSFSSTGLTFYVIVIPAM